MPSLSQIQTALCDIDGTLIDTEGNHDPSLAPAIQEAEERGARIGLCTNREIDFCNKICDLFELNGPIIYEDGASVVVGGEAVPLVPDDERMSCANDLLARAVQSRVLPTLAGHPDMTFEFNTKKQYSVSVHCFNYGERAYEFVQDVVPFAQKLMDEIGGLHVYDTGRGNFIVRYEDSGKGEAIKWLAEEGHIDPERTAVIGDGVNDVDAFVAIKELGGLAYAVRNAVPELKKVATATIPHDASLGVVNVLERIAQ